MSDRIVVSCEHGGRRVPARFAHLFGGADAALGSHRGWDPGALELARAIAAALGAPLYAATVTRLLVDLNRSRHHPHLFSEFSRNLPATERELILERHWRPYREEVERTVREAITGGAVVLHLSVHTFTPVLDGRERRTDVGFLYDPSREQERRFCRLWRRELAGAAPELRIRMNDPYPGVADGLTTHLRRRMPEPAYRGIELEVSQALVVGSDRGRRIAGKLVASLRATLDTAVAQPFKDAS